MSNEEIAKRYGVSVRTVQRKRNTGELESYLASLDVSPQGVVTPPDVTHCQNCGDVTGNEATQKLPNKDYWCASCAVRNNRLKATPELLAEISQNKARQS